MHPLLSVAAALALAAEPAPEKPASDEGVMTLPSVELSVPPAPAEPAKPPPPEPKKDAAKVSEKAPPKAAEPARAPTAAPTPAAPATAGDASAKAPAAPSPAAPPPPAEAKPQAPAIPRIAIVPLDAPADLAVLGRSLAEAIAQEAAKLQGVQVVPPGEVLAKLGADAGSQVTHCGEAAGCYAAPATRLGAERVVGGWIDRAGANYRFGLVLVDTKAGKAVGRVQREVPIASRRIRADVIAAAGPLLRGEAAATGVLAVLTEAPGAEVRIDDKSAGKTPLEAKLPSGKHKVEVSQRGKVKVEPFWVDVPANGRAEQRVRLYDIPLAERKPGEVETVVDIGKDKKRKR